MSVTVEHVVTTVIALVSFFVALISLYIAVKAHRKVDKKLKEVRQR